MRIRIPAPINQALDSVECRQWVASTAVSAAAVLLLVVAALGASTAAGIARLSAGDATAPTAQFLSIGESGELT